MNMEILFISCVTIWSVFQNPVTYVKYGCNTATKSGPEGMSLTHNLHIIGLYSPSMKDIHIGSVTRGGSWHTNHGRHR